MPIRNFLHVDLLHLTLMWFHRRKREKPVRPMLLFTEYAILTFVWKTLCLGILGEELTDVETTLTKKKWCKYSIFLQPDEAHSLNFRPLH